MLVTMPLWLLVGSRANWSTALRTGGLWGVKPSLRNDWERLKEGDFVLFYCTSPVSAIIGAGSVTAKFKQDTPLWPEETAAKKVIYPYRFDFKTAYLVPESEWKARGIKRSEVGLGYPDISRGLNEVTGSRLANTLTERVRSEFGIEIGGERGPPSPPVLDHAGVQQMLVELGTLQRFLSNKEYQMGRERLDVVWRRVEGSVPTYVFEVQVGGDLHHALGKLKHAYDIWNSQTILALPPEDVPKARELLSGTFHEARDRVKMMTLSDVQNLYLKKKEWSELEQRLGIFT